MKFKPLRIATRKSPLALRQSELVKHALARLYPGIEIILIPLSTEGDQLLEHSLSKIGGKGLFIKELERALLEDRADIAVHSMKDMPAQITAGLEITAHIERDDPRDALISHHYANLSEIPTGTKIGTASLRRQGMIHTFRNDLIVETLRGNVNTRLSKLDDGQFGAIVLASAGLHRLGLSEKIAYYFSPNESIPAIGQGIIGIQSRIKDKKIKKLLLPLDHYPTRICFVAERLLNQILNGSCHSPIGGYAVMHDNSIHIRGCVYSLKNAICLKAEHIFTFSPQSIETNIQTLAQKLFDLGAKEILCEND